MKQDLLKKRRAVQRGGERLPVTGCWWKIVSGCLALELLEERTGLDQDMMGLLYSYPIHNFPDQSLLPPLQREAPLNLASSQ